MREYGESKKVRLEYRDRWREAPESIDAFFLYLFTIEEKAWKEYLIDRLNKEHPHSALGPIAKAQLLHPSLTIGFRYYESEDDYEKAMKECRQSIDEALRRDDQSTIARYVSGQLAQAREENDLAKGEFEKAWQLLPDNSAIAYNHGLYSIEGKDSRQFSQGFNRQEALTAFGLALKNNKGWLDDNADVNCLVTMANTLAYNDAGQWNGEGADIKASEGCHLRAIDQRNNSFTRQGLLKLYCLLKDFSKAWKLLEQQDNVTGYERNSLFTSWALNKGNTTFLKIDGKLVISLKRIPWSSGYFWLVGDFNKWQVGVTPFTEAAEGYKATLCLGPGTYRYGFVSEKNDRTFYDPSAPTFIDKVSAFTINGNGEVQERRSSFDYHIARASYAFSTFDSVTLLEEGTHALQYDPNSSEALSYLCALTEGPFHLRWLALRPPSFSAAHEAYLTVASGRAEEKERRALLAKARAGGIRGPTLASTEAYAEEETTIRQDNLLAAIETYPQSENLVAAYSQLCTGPASVDALGQLVKEHPNSNLVYRYAAVLARNGSRGEAVKLLKSHLNTLEKNGSSCWKAVIDYAEDPNAEEQDKSKIVPLIEEGLRAFPHCRWLHAHYRGYLGNDEKSVQEAIAFLEKLKATNPKSPSITASIGWFHGQIGRDGLASKMYERALRQCPGWYWLLVRYGELLKNDGKFARALTIFERAYRLRQSDAYPATMAASIYSILGKEKERIQLLEKALINTHYANQQSFLRMKLARYYQFVAHNSKRALTLSLEELEYLQDQDKNTEAIAGFVAQAALGANEPLEFIKATKHYDGGILMAVIILIGFLVSFGFSGLMLLIFWYALRKVPLLVAILGTLFVLYVQICAQTVSMFAFGFALHRKFLAFMDVTSSTVGPLLLQISGIPAMAMGFLALLIIFYRRSEGPSKLGLKGLPTIKHLFIGVLGGIGLFGMQRLVTAGLIYIFGQMPSGLFGIQDEPYAVRLLHLSTLGLTLTVINVVILAPLFEELFFRAYVYRLWKEHMGYGKGLVFSCLVFAFLHFHGLIHLFLVAIVLCKLYDYTESLWPSMVAHGLMNAIVLTVGYLTPY